MRLLKEIHRPPGLNINGKAVCREAVRAIIIRDRHLLLIFSSTSGDYKFPGGGVDLGETHEEALIREVKEESGATITDIGQAFGKVLEYREPIEQGYDVFEMTSFYYICQVDPLLAEQTLDQYEQELGFTPVWVDIDEAIRTNTSLMSSSQDVPRWTPRETYVLELIRDGL